MGGSVGLASYTVYYSQPSCMIIVAYRSRVSNETLCVVRVATVRQDQ